MVERIAIVGISGAVGQEFLKLLENSSVSIGELLLFGSSRSAGKTYKFRGKEVIVKELKENDDFNGVNVALVSAGGDVSKKFAETITKYGAVMIDNSSAFRMDKEVPLVVPEVNPTDCTSHRKGIIANPNCSTIQMVVALNVVEKLSHIVRVHVSTYQAASGAGASGLAELESQIAQVSKGEAPTISKFKYQLAFNLIPQIDVFTENDYTKEEMKMFHETQKIMHSDILVSATCVRVPVLRAHSETIWCETERELSVQEVRDAFAKAEGVVLSDDPSKSEYPMPLFVSGNKPVYVGRIRKDISNPKGIVFWVVSDQLLKGAALNAVQIMEYMLANNLLNQKK